MSIAMSEIRLGRQAICQEGTDGDEAVARKKLALVRAWQTLSPSSFRLVNSRLFFQYIDVADAAVAETSTDNDPAPALSSSALSSETSGATLEGGGGSTEC